jgi:DNA-binding MarR family transcriptional regulator
MTTSDGRDRHVDDETYESFARAASGEMAPDINLDAMELGFNLIRAANRLQRDLEVNVHRPAGMTLAAFRVMFTIRTVGRITPNELARQSSISPASATSVLNTLERYGMIKRIRDADDGRSVNVHLTAKGNKTVAELLARNNQREIAWIAGLTEPERRRLVSLLRKLLSHSPEPPDEDAVNAAPVRRMPPRIRGPRSVEQG